MWHLCIAWCCPVNYPPSSSWCPYLSHYQRTPFWFYFYFYRLFSFECSLRTSTNLETSQTHHQPASPQWYPRRVWWEVVSSWVPFHRTSSSRVVPPNTNQSSQRSTTTPSPIEPYKSYDWHTHYEHQRESLDDLTGTPRCWESPSTSTCSGTTPPTQSIPQPTPIGV